jgi:peptidoglycan/LPS O-acetylase OafA/YrhL
MVCVAHFVPQLAGPAARRPIGKLGIAGVDVFFVISGYLITTLLLKELDRTGTISLARFYRRRLLRITPAYLTLLATAGVLAAVKVSPVDPRAWVYALTYTYNLVPGLGIATIGQVWSLCVEEHFYLLWPLTLLLLGKRFAPAVLVGSLGVAATLRLALFRSPAIDVDTFTFTRIDTIAIGCLLAFAARAPWAERVRGWRWALFGVAALFLSIYGLSHSGKYTLVLKSAFEGTAIAIIIQALSRDVVDPATRLLDRPFVAGIGRLSYSLYLGQFALDPLQPWTFSPWLRLPILAAYALFSYHLVEQPFLRLKDRLEQRSDAKRAPG